MKEKALQADDGWRNICCLWGLHNTDHIMTKQQLEVRNAILATKRIHENVDLLFINAAYETSINIENEDFRVVIVHSSNPDVQTQVRGRLRHDIDTFEKFGGRPMAAPTGNSETASAFSITGRPVAAGASPRPTRGALAPTLYLE